MNNALLALLRRPWALALATSLLLAMPGTVSAESTDVIDSSDADAGSDDAADDVPDVTADTDPADVPDTTTSDTSADTADVNPDPDADLDTVSDTATDAVAPDATPDATDGGGDVLPGDVDFDTIAPGGPVLQTVAPPTARRGGTIDVILAGTDLLTTDQWRLGSVPIFDLRALEEGTRLAGVFDSESLPAGTYDITIARDGQLIGGLQAAFRLTEDTEPELTFRIDSVDPPLVRVGELAELTIIGEGFLEGATVLIDGFVLDETTLRDDTRLEALALPDSFPGPGVYAVTVRQEDGREATLPDAITAIAARPAEDEGCSAAPVRPGFSAALGLLVLGLVRRRRSSAPVA